MPKGKNLANLMDHEEVEMMYTCCKHGKNTIDFGAVAVELGLKDASTAKTRLARVMKAQEKGSDRTATAAPNKQYKVTKPAAIGETKRSKKTKPTVVKGGDSGDNDGAANDDKAGSQDGGIKGEEAEVEGGIKAESEEGAENADINGVDKGEA